MTCKALFLVLVRTAFGKILRTQVTNILINYICYYELIEKRDNCKSHQIKKITKNVAGMKVWIIYVNCKYIHF